MDAVEKKFPEIIRSVHLHIRFPMKAIRNTRQFEGYVSQMADAISVFRLQNARSTSIALRSDTVRRNGREQIFSRGAVRLQFLEGYDLELRGFMNRISEMKSYLLPLMDAIGHDRFPEGTSEWQSLVTSPRRELGKFLSSEYGLEMNEYNLRRLAIVQNSVIDERAILPLAGFEFSPFVSPESAARIQQANTDYFRSLVSLIQTKSVRDDVLADSSRNLMKRWGEKSGIVEILFAGLDTSETILRSEWRGLELIKSLAAWHESSPRLVRQFFDVLGQQFPDVCQGLITRK